jgi:Tol biopolymer transport system component
MRPALAGCLLAVVCAGAAHAQPSRPIVLVAGDAHHASYSASGDIYTVRADGSGLRRVRAWPHVFSDGDVYGAYEAQWSPDGNAIWLVLAYWCGDPCAQVARADADGSRLTRVIVPADVGGAVWSSRGDAAVTTFNGDQLWIVSMNGGAARRVCCRKGGRASDPAWSPDGTELVLRTVRGIERMAPTGTFLARLAPWGDAPQWSPDGRSVAIVRRSRCSGELECNKPDYLYVVDRDVRALHRLAATAGVDSFLWLRDGRSIVFEAGRGLERVTASGGRPRRLTAAANDHALALSPDGRRLLFGRDGLWSIRTTGGGLKRLVTRERWTVLSADWAR